MLRLIDYLGKSRDLGKGHTFLVQIKFWTLEIDHDDNLSLVTHRDKAWAMPGYFLIWSELEDLIYAWSSQNIICINNE